VCAFEGSNRQPHSEQPNPPKPGCSIHTTLRLMGASAATPQRVPAGCPGTRRAGSPLTAPLATVSCLIAAENRHPVLGGGRFIEVSAKLACANLDGLSGILRTFWFARTSDLAGVVCGERNRIMRGSCFVRRDVCASAVLKPMWDTLQKRHGWTLYDLSRTASEQSFCSTHHDG
jgi:hypothetical protein